MKFNKVINGIAIAVMVGAFGAGAAFAQEDATDETTGEQPAIAVTCLLDARGERGDFDRDALLLELGITQEDIDAAREAGTLRDLIEENQDALQALRDEARAEMQAAVQATLLGCVDEALEDGRLTEDEAARLTDAIETDTLRDALESGEFDDIFPRAENVRERIENRENRRGDRQEERGERRDGRGGFGGRGGSSTGNGGE